MSYDPAQMSLDQSVSMSSTNIQFSSNDKYGGLIKRKMTKQIRDRLYLLLNYFDNTVPQFYILHTVISIWRAIQFIGPSIMAASTVLWVPDSIASNGVSVISVIFHLVPPEYRSKSTIFIELIYFVFLLAFFIAIIGASYYFKETAKLSSKSSSFLTIFMNTFLYILPPIAINISGEVLSTIIQGDKTNFPLALEIICIIFVLLISVFNLYAFHHVIALTVTYRPTSFMTTFSTPQVLIALFTYLTTFLTAVASHLSKLPQAILLIVTAIVYFLSFSVILCPGTCVSLRNRVLLFCCSCSGCLNCLCLAIYVILEKHADQPQFFVFIAIIVASYIGGYFVTVFIDRSRIDLLNLFSETQENASLIKSSTHFLRLACTGFEYAHPACLNWTFFNYGTETYPNDIRVWELFAKCLAIYPEETNLLGYVISNIVSHHLTGYVAKETIGHSTLIQMQRENTLSVELKKKMGQLQKTYSDMKRKIRSVWDLVIQSNVHELENAINAAYVNHTNVHNDFVHMIIQYPNNRFVARAYARFLSEIDGDHSQSTIWLEKVRTLHRGAIVNEDIINTMGLHAFPLLPAVVKPGGMKSNNATQSFMESESMNQLMEGDTIDDDNNQMLEQSDVLRNRINEVKIPSIRCMIINSLILVFLFIIVPAIVILAYAPIYINSNTTPLEFMSVLALLRSYNFQLPLWAHHWITEILPFQANDNKPMFQQPEFTHIPPTLGSTTSTHGQFKYLLHEFSACLENLQSFRSYETNNPKLASVHKSLFQSDSTSYDYYLNITTSVPTTGSLMSLYLDQLIQLSSMSEEEPDFSMYGSYKLLNPYLNANAMAIDLSASLISLTSFISDNSNSINKIMEIIEISCCIGFGLIWIICLVVQVMKLEKNKMTIYRCLTSLPKNIVSQISESLRSIKNDNENDNTHSTELNTEISKQEDGILKLFASIGDSASSSSSNNIHFILLNIALLVISIVNMVLLASIFPQVTKTMTTNTPHLDDVMGTTAYMVGIFLALNNAVIGSENGYDGQLPPKYGIGGRPFLSSLERVSTRLDSYLSYYHKARYGWPETNEPPFEKYNPQLIEAANTLKCQDENEIYTDYHHIVTCLPIDSQLLLFEPFVNKFTRAVIVEFDGAEIHTSDKEFIELWILACNLYDTLFFPMFDGIVPSMTDMMSSALPPIEAAVIVLIVVACILEIILISFILNTEKKMRYGLNMLVLCPINSVLQTSAVNDVLLDDFSEKTHESSLRGAHYYESLIQHIPFAIMIANPQYQIITANAPMKELFDGEVEGDIRTVLQSDLYDKLFHNKTGKGEVIQGHKNGTYKFYSDQIMQNYFVYAIDITDQQGVIQQIQTERDQIDYLLQSILPSNLVSHVKNGETAITFAIQLASIIFLDLNKFLTKIPTTYNNDPVKILSTLNEWYQKLDDAIESKSSLVKVKSYGNTYMAAGGLFNEVNIPTEIARQTVEFALEALEIAHQLNLEVRIGIHVSGPIIAGVVGVERPSFEVFGEGVSFAYQVELTAPPNSIQISRNVYELIYGGQFNTKERGQVEISQGKILAYLVERK